MVNPIPLITIFVSTAAAFISTTSTSFARKKCQHQYSHKPLKEIEKVERALFPKSEENGNAHDVSAEDSPPESENNSLLDLLPIPPSLKENAKENDADNTHDEDHATSLSFDITSTDQWKEAVAGELSEFWSRVLDPLSSSSSSNHNQDEANDGNDNQPPQILKPLEALFGNDNSDKQDNNDKPIQDSFQEKATRWMGYLSAPGGGTEQSIQDMIDTAREGSEQDANDRADQQSFQEVVSLFQQYSADLTKSADKYFANVDMDLSQLRGTSLFYYFEREDEVKNPSWKRRMHRFYPGVGVERMNHLNDALTLAQISYLDSVQEVKERLEGLTNPYELVYCDLAGETQKPAHYLAIKQHQQPLSPSLELVLGVRGTKTMTDAITDLLCEEAEYRGGKAHAGILASGKYIAEKHTPLIQELLQSSGKQRVRIQLVGHSLGAGAVTIAAAEFRDQPQFDVEAVGFGSPACVSKEVSEEMKDYVTSVVADDDLVPRLSGPTLINALLDVMEYDYVPGARRDIEHALSALHELYPSIVTSDRIEHVVSEFVDPLLEAYVAPKIKEATTERLDPILFPPGDIIHLYRNGAGISGSLVPCTFFDRIDLRRAMIDDHLFHSGYERIFLDVMRLHNQDHAFQFENPVTPLDDESTT